MKLASWNINSLRARLDQVSAWLASRQPDLLALQETKVADEAFPAAELEAAGYHPIFSGQKAYNGVAILSRRGLGSDITTSLPSIDDPARRVLAATFDDLRLINLYVPNGGSGAGAYRFKLRWLEALAEYLALQLHRYRDVAVVGDFNLAPDERDVHDPLLWANRVLFTPPERVAFQRLLEVGLVDAFRLFEPASGHFTWWDYRLGAFAHNRGLRIDHVLLSPPLAARCRACRIDTEPRGWERPSDHAPIVAQWA